MLFDSGFYFLKVLLSLWCLMQQIPTPEHSCTCNLQVLGGFNVLVLQPFKCFNIKSNRIGKFFLNFFIFFFFVGSCVVLLWNPHFFLAKYHWLLRFCFQCHWNDSNDSNTINWKMLKLVSCFIFERFFHFFPILSKF